MTSTMRAAYFAVGVYIGLLVGLVAFGGLR